MEDAFPRPTDSAVETRLSVVCDPEAAESALDAGIPRVCCPAEALIDSPAFTLPPEKRVWFTMPAVTPFPFFRKAVAWLERNLDRIEGVIAGHAGCAVLAVRHGLPCWADASFNVMNTAALEQVRALGLAGAALSWEADPESAARIAAEACLPVEVILLGRPPLMQTGLKHLASEPGPHTLLDEQGRHCPLRPWPGGSGYTILAPFFRLGIEKIAELRSRAAFLRADLREIPARDHGPILDSLRAVIEGAKTPAEVRSVILDHLAAPAASAAGWTVETHPETGKENHTP
jgi:hypothetical protein